MRKRHRLQARVMTPALLIGGPAQAHGIDGHAGLLGSGWFVFTVAMLLVAGGLYLRGVLRLWSRTYRSAGARRRQAFAFLGGWLSLAVALLSPIDAWGEKLFSMHMIQHEILMLVSAPLLVAGRPAILFLWAFGVTGRRRIGGFVRHRWWRAAWRTTTHPLTAWSLYGLVLWIWHAPPLFEAAITRDGIHALQHASFLGASLLFWWMLLYGRHARTNDGIGVVAVFTTAVHSSLLGAFLTFSSTAWYEPYLDTTALWNLEPIEDQQLGGLIMWIPGGLVHLAAGMLILARWMREAELRDVRSRASLHNLGVRSP